MIQRNRITAAYDPNAILSEALGPKFLAYRKNFSRAESGERPEIPLHLDVDVTTACNFHCPMCPAGSTRHNFPGFQKGLFLDRRLYQKALAEGASFGLPSIRLGMTGEPLLIPDMAGWVAEAKEAGVLDISLITNGRLLTYEMSQRLIEAGLTRLMISVDAASAATYEKVRPGGSWSVLLQNLESFKMARDRAGTVFPLLRLSFVEMAVNQGDRARFEKIFGHLADYFAFQRYHNILGGAETNFSPAEAGRGQGGFCSEPFTRLALHADGGLFPCCSDFGRRKPLGNLKTGGLLATWLSKEAQSVAGPDFARHEPCRSCLGLDARY